MRNNISLLKKIGPGIIVAATGVGAGDLITVSVAGAKYGYVLLWAVVLGGLLKYVLNEGISRWQLSTNTSVLNAWQTKFPKFISWYFLIYLILWTFIVSAALMAACGLAGYSLYPDFSVTQWGIAHALVAFIIVYMGKYRSIEALMKFFIAIMFVVKHQKTQPLIQVIQVLWLKCLFLLRCVEKSCQDSTRGMYNALQSTTKVSRNIRTVLFFPIKIYFKIC